MTFCFEAPHLVPVRLYQKSTTVGPSFGPYTDHSVLYRTTLSVTLGLTYTSIGRASLVTKHTRHCGRFEAL